MRRWLAGALVGLTLVSLAACARPAGVDGAVADDWPQPAAPASWTPKAGECHLSIGDVIFLTVYQPVACTAGHRLETLFVGTFTGDAAARQTLPPEGSPEARAAYAECVTRTKDVLGDDYRAGRVELSVGLPSTAGWSGGARWFRCDVYEYGEDNDDVRRTESLQGTLAPGGPLRTDCYTFTDQPGTDVDSAPAACTASHNGEFAGLYFAPDIPAPANEKEVEALADHCGPVVAAYAGLPNDRNLLFRVSYVYYWYGEAEWDRGNRAVHCSIWLRKPATRLMKGAGPSAFPVN